MAKYVIVAQSRAKEGRDDEYNDWYEVAHLPELLALPGVKSGRRFRFETAMVGTPGLDYLAIYEIEADDIGVVLSAMGKAAADGSMSRTESLDAPASVLWFYREIA